MPFVSTSKDVATPALVIPSRLKFITSTPATVGTAVISFVAVIVITSESVDDASTIMSPVVYVVELPVIVSFAAVPFIVSAAVVSVADTALTVALAVL
jgi:hypothetical protein